MRLSRPPSSPLAPTARDCVFGYHGSFRRAVGNVSVLCISVTGTAYPILDYRALEALGIKRHVNTISFWSAYVAACRALDDETGFGMRTIDRALWQWSKEQGRD